MLPCNDSELNVIGEIEMMLMLSRLVSELLNLIAETEMIHMLLIAETDMHVVLFQSSLS